MPADPGETLDTCSLSKDGRWIVYSIYSGPEPTDISKSSVKLYEISTGESRTLVDGAFQPELNSDGSRVVVRKFTGMVDSTPIYSIVAVNTANGEKTEIARDTASILYNAPSIVGHYVFVQYEQFTPDAKFITFGIMAFDLNDLSKNMRIGNPGSYVESWSMSSDGSKVAYLSEDTRERTDVGIFSQGVFVAPAFEANKPPVDTTPPAPIGNLHAEAAGSNVTVSWTSPSDEDFDHILLYVKRPGQDGYDLPVTIEKTTSQQILKGLEPGTYTIKVVAVDTSGNLSPETTIQITVSSSSPSPSPSTSPTPGPVSGGGGGPIATPKPSVAPAPDTNETVFYLTKEASSHSGFKQAIRLDADALTVNQDTPVTVRKSEASSILPQAGYRAVSNGFTLSSEKSFNKKAYLTLAIPESALKGLDPQKLGIFKQNNDKTWSYIGGSLSKDNKEITAPISGSGSYSILLSELTFQDIKGHWAQTSIEIAAGRQLMDGVSPSLFEPERPITRAETARLLVQLLRYADKYVIPSGNSTPKFSDVSKSSKDYNAIMEAANAGLVKGDAEGTFRPNDPVTREELAVVLYKLCQSTVVDNKEPLKAFKDANSISTWARMAVEFAKRQDILNGMPDGTLQPRGKTTRAQAAIIGLKVLQLLQPAKTPVSAALSSLDVTLYDTTGKKTGWAVLTPMTGGVHIQLKATGLKPGKHGFHLHEKAFSWMDLKTAGGHFNPEGKKHGSDNPQGHHLGDLPNLVVEADGTTSTDFMLNGTSLWDAAAAGALNGRSIIIHAAEDDYKTDPAGNAGDRIVGGIIAE